jgi:hypothetical protein
MVVNFGQAAAPPEPSDPAPWDDGAALGFSSAGGVSPNPGLSAAFGTSERAFIAAVTRWLKVLSESLSCDCMRGSTPMKSESRKTSESADLPFDRFAMMKP